MVVLSGGMRVWVEVGGKEAEEYRINHISGSKSNTTTCFIEAKEGKAFRVFYNKIPTEAKHQTKVKLSIDGTEVSQSVFCLHKPDEQIKGAFKGYVDCRSETKKELRAFVFGKAQTTNEGTSQDLPRHLKEEGCSIRLDITVTARGKYRHGKSHSTRVKSEKNEEENDLPQATIVHEDTKPAVLGLLAERGEVLSTWKPNGKGKYCYCSITQPPKYHQVVIFHYLSHDWLIRGGHKKDPRAELQSKNVLAVKDCNVQLDLQARFENEINASKALEKNGTLAYTNAQKIKKEIVTEEVEPVQSSVKRRAESEPLFERPSAKIKQEDHLSIDQITVVKQEMEDVIAVASNAAAPAHLQLDITGEGDKYEIIKAPIEVIEISDEE